MKFYLPKMSDENRIISFDEYARRTELITMMELAGWLTDFEIQEYLKGIIAEASTIDEDGGILWCIGPLDGMPGDTFRDCILSPLYNIVVFMTKAYFTNPSYMEEIDGFRKTIKGALISVNKYSLKPETIDLLEQGGLYQFLHYNQDLCPELYEKLERLRK